MADFSSIFKAYDVRGRTEPGGLTEEAARAIGAGFAEFVQAPTVAVGRDCRLSSPGLAAAFIDGATSRGVDVLDLGEVATDIVYYVSGARQVPGAMITASHNPPEYNGIKMCRQGAAPIGAESGLVEIRRLAESSLPAADRRGIVTAFDPIPGYVDHLLSIVEPEVFRPLRVGVDAGNGMAGVVIERIFERIPPTLTGLYLEPDGTFPNHPADPLDPANLVDLIDLVRREKLDLGVAFDGDADRAFFVDDQAQALSGSTVTALVARWFLARNPGAAIVHNLITSRAVPETIIAHGGRPIRTRVGHSFIKQVMAETGAVFGGEHSGHYYFADNFRADSGMLAMLVLLQVVSEDGRPLSQIRTEVEPYVASGEINFRVEDQAAAIEAVASHFSDADQDRLDGLTVSWPDRWFNLRPSNTEPLLRLNVEAPDAASVDELVSEVRDVIEGRA
ncbi:MAG: phosphomannomutase/phosphoglucomutase [Actinomycetes bacterium]|jgi:phosphomannomutase|nr:phosphomannomutase/phosphoglucomutase [Acidimicrobiia bacterium]